MLIGTKHSGYSRANIRLYFDPVTIMATATAAETAAAVTAAEIAAAEAAAIAAAEAAAATAAAEAAAATAATEAAATAATAANAAPAFNPAGIMEIGGTTAAPGATPLTAEAVQAAATNQMTPAQLEYLRASTASNVPGAVPGQGMLPAQPLPNVDLAQYGIKGAEFTQPSVYMPEFDPSAAAMPSGPVPYESSFLPAENGLSTQFGNTPGTSPYQMGRPPATSSTEGLRMGSSGFSPTNAPAPTGSGLQSNMSSMSNMFPNAPKEPSTYDKVLKYAKDNPFQTGAAMYMGASKLGLLDPSKETFNDEPYDGPLSRYRLSPDFKGSTATPNIYKPTYPTYAAGGIMNAGPVQSMSDQNNAMGYQQAMAATGGQVANFASGGKTGNLSDSLDYYKSMMGDKKLKAPSDPAYVGSVGIARDDDPDTRSRDALTAAQIRNSKVAKRANLSIPNMKRPTPMGQINLAAPGIKGSGQQEDVQEAAGGGIMGASSLGGYAAGGNPRLLKGPGDGMSDNIPAVIGKKQPARLADGEFVIPADVVSHLGNGSTDAGAKRLHEMMNKVRRDRTGNSKQGKQIVASKYMPK